MDAPSLFQSPGVQHKLPAFFEALKRRQTFPLAWTPQITDLGAWRQAGRHKLWELSQQSPDDTAFDPVVHDEQDRGSYVARKLLFNITAESRVQALLLVPKGVGPFPAALMLHDHGSRFDIGKEKLIQTWGDPARQQSSQEWAERFFSGRFPGDALAQRGYVVLATDALGWGDRGGLDFEDQQALAANLLSLGSSLAGLMALEDTRAVRFLASQSCVAAHKLAAVGFSMGAFRAWQLAALSDDVTACVAACWMATLDGLLTPGNNWLNGASAWHMLHPGLARHLDVPDVASLAAPKPMLCFAGQQDKLFPPEPVAAAFGKMRQVWHAYGADNALDTRLLPGGHEFIASTQDAAYDWLDGQLTGRSPS